MLKDHPFITLAKGPGGCVLNMASFADVQNCFYTNIVPIVWVLKSSKLCLRNIWMVPKRNK